MDFGVTTASEIAVSPERAMRCVPVYAGIRVRCETIGSLPFILYERRPIKARTARQRILSTSSFMIDRTLVGLPTVAPCLAERLDTHG